MESIRLISIFGLTDGRNGVLIFVNFKNNETLSSLKEVFVAHIQCEGPKGCHIIGSMSWSQMV